MTKANLEIDFGSLGPDEIANAMGLLGAALRGAIVPRNSLTGAIEITEGPDAVEGTATIGAIDAFFHTGYFSNLNIDGSLVTARTLLPTIPTILTRPVGATEAQAEVQWAWPYDLETEAFITLILPQAGGRGGTSGRWLTGGFNYPLSSGINFEARALRGDLSSLAAPPYSDILASRGYIPSIARGDILVARFGQGGAGSPGGAPLIPDAGGNPGGAIDSQASLNGQGYTSLRRLQDNFDYRIPRLVDTPPDPITIDYSGAPSDGIFSVDTFTSPFAIQNFGGTGANGKRGTSVLRGSGDVPTAGEAGGAGFDGAVIIQPFRRTL